MILGHAPRCRRRTSVTLLSQFTWGALGLLVCSPRIVCAQEIPRQSVVSHLAWTAGGGSLGAFSGLTAGVIYDTIECRRFDRDPLFGCFLDLHHGAKVGFVLGSVAGTALTADALNRRATRCEPSRRRWRAWLGASLGAAPAVVWLARSPHWQSERYNRLAMLTPLIQAGTTSLLLSACR